MPKSKSTWFIVLVFGLATFIFIADGREGDDPLNPDIHGSIYGKKTECNNEDQCDDDQECSEGQCQNPCDWYAKYAIECKPQGLTCITVSHTPKCVTSDAIPQEEVSTNAQLPSGSTPKLNLTTVTTLISATTVATIPMTEDNTSESFTSGNATQTNSSKTRDKTENNDNQPGYQNAIYIVLVTIILLFPLLVIGVYFRKRLARSQNLGRLKNDVERNNESELQDFEGSQTSPMIGGNGDPNTTLDGESGERPTNIENGRLMVTDESEMILNRGIL